MKKCRVVKIENEKETLFEAGIPDSELQNFLDHFNKDGYKVQYREHTEKDSEEFWKDVKGGIIL